HHQVRKDHGGPEPTLEQRQRVRTVRGRPHGVAPAELQGDRHHLANVVVVFHYQDVGHRVRTDRSYWYPACRPDARFTRMLHINEAGSSMVDCNICSIYILGVIDAKPSPRPWAAGFRHSARAIGGEFLRTGCAAATSRGAERCGRG